MKRLCLVLSLIIQMLVSQAAMSENRGVDMARGLSERFLEHIARQEYSAAHGMMDPISRQAISPDQFMQTVKGLDTLFGALVSYIPEQHEHIVFKFPGSEDVYPAIDFTYKSRMGKKSRNAEVTVTMTLIDRPAQVGVSSTPATATP